MSGQVFEVRIGNAGATIACAAGQTILRASLAAGLDYPYGCASGNCGVCISRVESGQASMLPRSDASLSPEQEAAGIVLACRALPRSDMAIMWLGRGRR